MEEHNRVQKEEQGSSGVRSFADLCCDFLRPLLVELNGRLDRRLVRTFLGLVIAIITRRHRNQGLLLSELGGYLLPPAQAQAGTKRLSRLLLSRRWSLQVGVPTSIPTIRRYLMACFD
jgi:hypothetical protein